MFHLCTIHEDEECVFNKLLNKLSLIEIQYENDEHIYNLINNIKKWCDIYINDFFYDLSSEMQIIFLKQIKKYFLSIFDCSLGGELFHYKLLKIFEKDNYDYNQIMNDIIDRLKRILSTIGVKIFEYLKIPLIKYNQIYILNHNQIIKYFSIIFIKIRELLDKTIQSFEELYEKLKF